MKKLILLFLVSFVGIAFADEPFGNNPLSIAAAKSRKCNLGQECGSEGLSEWPQNN